MNSLFYINQRVWLYFDEWLSHSIIMIRICFMTTGHQMTFQFFNSPNIRSPTTWKNLNQQNIAFLFNVALLLNQNNAQEDFLFTFLTFCSACRPTDHFSCLQQKCRGCFWDTIYAREQDRPGDACACLVNISCRILSSHTWTERCSPVILKNLFNMLTFAVTGDAEELWDNFMS